MDTTIEVWCKFCCDPFMKSSYEQVYQYKDQRIRFIAIDESYAPFKSFSGILNQPELDSLEKMLQRNKYDLWFVSIQ